MAFAEIASLCADREIKYEMRCRGVEPNDYTTRARVDWWKGQLKKEAKEPMQIKSYMEVKEDLEEANIWFTDLTEEAESEDPTLLERVEVRLRFLETRVKRIVVSDAADDIAMQDVLLNGIAALKERVEEVQYKIWRGSGFKDKNKRSTIGVRLDTSVHSESQREERGIEETTRSHEESSDELIASLLVSEHEERLDSRLMGRGGPKLYKWPIKFTGDRDRMSASEFLQRIADFARSRRVTGREVLESLSDVLDGSALRWYRRERDSLTSYKVFVKLFLSEFESLNSADKLLDFIKERRQEADESIVQFIAQVEDMFLRLPKTPPAFERVKIIRKT